MREQPRVIRLPSVARDDVSHLSHLLCCRTNLVPVVHCIVAPTTVLPAAEYGQPRVIDPASMASFLRIALEDAPTAKGGSMTQDMEALDLKLRVSLSLCNDAPEIQ